MIHTLLADFSWLGILLLLIVWHFIADYPLQGDYLAKHKNDLNYSLYQGKMDVTWWYAMIVHCAIQAGGVLLITTSAFLALMDFAVHFIIDFSKARGQLTYLADQGFHIATRIVIWLIVMMTYYGVY